MSVKWLWTERWTVSMQEDSTTHAGLTSVWWHALPPKQNLKGQRSHACWSAFELTVQQLLVAYGLHEPYHAVVSCGQTLFPMQYVMAHGNIHYCKWLRQKHKSYISILLLQNIHLSEVSIIPITSWISTSYQLHCTTKADKYACDLWPLHLLLEVRSGCKFRKHMPSDTQTGGEPSIRIQWYGMETVHGPVLLESRLQWFCTASRSDGEMVCGW